MRTIASTLRSCPVLLLGIAVSLICCAVAQGQFNQQRDPFDPANDPWRPNRNQDKYQPGFPPPTEHFCPNCQVQLNERLAFGQRCPHCNELMVTDHDIFADRPQPTSPPPGFGSQASSPTQWSAPTVSTYTQQRLLARVLAVVLGLVIAAISLVYRTLLLDRSYINKHATQNADKSMGRLLNVVGKGTEPVSKIAEQPDRWPWLRAAGWRGLELETVAQLQKIKPHPWRRWSHILWPGLWALCFTTGITVILLVVFTAFEQIEPHRVVNAAIGGMALGVLVAATLVAGRLWIATRVRHYTQEAQAAAKLLGLDYLHYTPISPDTSHMVFPLVDIEPLCTHVVMLGSLGQVLLAAGFVRYEVRERHWGQTQFNTHCHFAVSFPQRLGNVPDFICKPTPEGYEVGCATHEGVQLVAELMRSILAFENGWWLIVRNGQLTLWRGEMEEWCGQVAPGDAEHTANYVRTAVQVRSLLATALLRRAYI